MLFKTYVLAASLATLTIALAAAPEPDLADLDLADLDLADLDFAEARLVDLPAPLAVDARPAALAVLDFDGDGIDDVAVLRRGQGGADLALRLGNAAAVYPHHPPRPGAPPASEPFAGHRGPFAAPAAAAHLVVLDLDLDARPDLVILGDDAEPLGWLPGGLEALDPEAIRPLPAERLERARTRRALEEAVGRAEETGPIQLVEPRLSPHAAGDIVLLDGAETMTGESDVVRFVPRAPGAVFTVNSSLDTGDSYDFDGICDTANNPTLDPPVPPSGLCTLRAAIEQANFTGDSTIDFAIGAGAVTIPVGSVLEIEVPLILDAASQPGFAGVPLVRLDRVGGGLFPGLSIMAGPTLVRGFVIGGFSTEGVAIFADDVIVEACYLGTDAAGAAADANFRGVASSGARTRLGGSAPEAGNLISGNFDGGVLLSGVDGAVFGNRIGTNAAGTVALGNGLAGVGVKVLPDADRAQVGSPLGAGGNLISGQNNIGLWLQAPMSSAYANWIGTDAAGTSALPNFAVGVYVQGADDAVVGAMGVGAGNLVSGNNGDGILIAGAQRVAVVANDVGVDSSGVLPLGNGGSGIRVEKDSTTPSAFTVIGGFGGGARESNVVASNGATFGGHGILVGDSVSNTAIGGNRIGTDLSGTLDLGNFGDGVRLLEASDSYVGAFTSLVLGEPNVIKWNAGAGIAVLDDDASAGSQNTNGNHLTYNRLIANGGLGIDLAVGTAAPDGPTANDAGDVDFGANRLQNHPLVTAVSEPSPGTFRVEGTLESEASTPYEIWVFTNDTCDPSGFGEAHELAGLAVVTTDPTGFATFSVDALMQVNLVTALAVNRDTKDSSELSPCFESSPGGRLGNRVWDDLDGDGIQDLGEPGIPGVVVRLRDTSGTVILDTTATDLAGFYDFTGVATGTYRIGVSPPDGYAATLANQGDDGLDSDIDPGFLTAPFAYTAGSLDLSRDAGLTSLIFADDFETGDVSEWSTSVGKASSGS